MPTPKPIPLGAPCWIDLMTDDAAGAQVFYGELFGWTAEASGAEYGGYITYSLDGKAVAGGMQNDGTSGWVNGWSVYLATDDAQVTVDKATASGAQVIVAPMEVPQQGTMAVLLDPGQASVGVWQPAEHKGFQVMAEHGAPAWFELHTRDYAAAVAFYENVFGWDTHVASDSPEFRYTTFGEGEDQHAGVMDDTVFGPDVPPPHWAVYFGVEDADKAVARIGELGGSVLRGPDDSPHGRLAEVADPTGVAFRIVGVG
jgi:hypothetical protein